MMRILHNYIGKTVIGATLMVVLILVGLEIFIEFVDELSDIGKGSYGVMQALQYVPLLLPNDIYQLFPVAGLIGALIGLGRLATNSELIVMRAAGVSKAKITWSVVRATILMLVVVTIVGEWLAPHSKEWAENLKVKAVSGAQTLPTRQGLWVRDGDNFIHINVITPQGKLAGIVRYQFSNGQLQLASVAQSGYFSQGNWILSDVDETKFTDAQTLSTHYAQQNWNVAFDPDLLGLTQIQADQSSLVTLYQYINYLKANGLMTDQYQFDFYKRLLQPIATIVMICLAIPFIFGPLRTVTMGLRILIGVVVGFSFYTLNEFFGPFSLVYQIPPIWAASLPILLFAGIDGLLLFFVR